MNLTHQTNTHQAGRSVEQSQQRNLQSNGCVREKPVATPETIIQSLAPILTLCCPSGMTQSDREEWLIAAALQIQNMGLTDYILADALKTIIVDHPAKIMPAIAAYVGKWHNPIITQPSPPKPAQEPIAIEQTAAPLTLAEIRAMPPQLIEMGLKKGWIKPEQIEKL